MLPVFSVEDTEVASVSSDGIVTGLHNGVTTVHLRVADFCQDFTIVVGGTPVENLEVVLLSDCITVGTVITPGFQIIPADANYYSDISFYSSDETILKKDGENPFIAVAPGVVYLCVQTYSKELVRHCRKFMSFLRQTESLFNHIVESEGMLDSLFPTRDYYLPHLL